MEAKDITKFGENGPEINYLTPQNLEQFKIKPRIKFTEYITGKGSQGEILGLYSFVFSPKYPSVALIQMEYMELPCLVRLKPIEYVQSFMAPDDKIELVTYDLSFHGNAASGIIAEKIK